MTPSVFIPVPERDTAKPLSLRKLAAPRDRAHYGRVVPIEFLRGYDNHRAPAALFAPFRWVQMNIENVPPIQRLNLLTARSRSIGPLALFRCHFLGEIAHGEPRLETDAALAGLRTNHDFAPLDREADPGIGAET